MCGYIGRAVGRGTRVWGAGVRPASWGWVAGRKNVEGGGHGGGMKPAGGRAAAKGGAASGTVQVGAVQES